jgi:type I restriction enzyme S subunit
MTGAVGQQRVPKNFLETYPCPLPPFKEQKVIADHLDALLSYEYDFQTILDREDDIMTLTQSILNKAFRGELGTNNPEEESALELLKEVLLEQAEETIDNPKSKANRQGSLLLV